MSRLASTAWRRTGGPATLALFALGCLTGRPARGAPPAQPVLHRALWVWDRGEAALHPEAQARLFAFSTARGFDTLYYDCADLWRDDPAALAGFLDEAAARGFAVELLFSSRSWVHPWSHARAVSLVRGVAHFTRTLTGARPSALHFDLEPYLLPEWKAGSEERMASDYLNLLSEIEAVRGSLPVHVDIPFWFCRTRVAWPRGGAERPLDQALLGIVDGCTVMDYRNRADGTDGIVADGSQTLADAEALGKPVVIGVETNRVRPSYVTFYRLGARAVDRQLAAVDDQFEGVPAFAGTAVEDYRGYRQLRP